ncbi:ATP-binding protein [Rothia sp. HC945]|uniref:ATP-binding protein n=1 Tax=Rothia sp. HC945 TaxID=3171170 RepID=UPI003F28DF7C
MKLNPFKKIASMVGFDEARKTPPVHYHSIAEGLLVTDTRAEAWFDLDTANLDTATDDQKLASLDEVKTAATKALGNRACHLKLLWSNVSGEEYYESVKDLYTGGLGDGDEWAKLWANRLEDLGLPKRHLMLGVTLNVKGTIRGEQVKRGIDSALGEHPDRIPEDRLVEFYQDARRIMRTLQRCALHARLAPAEKIAWMISRETARAKNPIPRSGQISGAQLAQLTASKVLPYPDHLRLYDEAGDVTTYVAVLPIFDFPEQIEVPGDAEWLRTLSAVTRLGEVGVDENGEMRYDDVPVFADASIRFQVLPKARAMKVVDEARKQAKEQRRSAEKHSAGEVPPDIEEAETDNENLLVDLKNSSTTLVTQHPRLVATATNKDDLDENIDALIAHYADLGISVSRGEDEQRDLWLEMLPGDTLRVTDLGQTQTDVGFWGSFFWAGSKVGDRTGGMSGYTTGTTTSPFRVSIMAGGERAESTTTAITGKSGVGKSTAMTLMMISEMLRGPKEAFGIMQDYKGDLSGVVTLCQRFGIESDVIRIGAEHTGAFDLFRVLEPAEAPAAIQRVLALQAMDRRHIEVANGAALRYANIEQAESDHPTTYGLIQRMKQDSNADIASFGEYLEDLSHDAIGGILFGEPTGSTALTSKPGLWLLQLPNLTLPSAEISPAQWDASHRRSLGLIQCVTTYSMSVTSATHLRDVRKIVGIPEVHLLLNAHGGAAFLDQIARMGRAFNTSQALDSQDCTSIAGVEGLVEQINTFVCFQFLSEKQQRAAAELLGMEPTPETLRMIESLAYQPGSEELRKGHALVKDRLGHTATVQFDYPSEEVGVLLDTNPDADIRRERYYEDQLDAAALEERMSA